MTNIITSRNRAGVNKPTRASRFNCNSPLAHGLKLFLPLIIPSPYPMEFWGEWEGMHGGWDRIVTGKEPRSSFQPPPHGHVLQFRQGTNEGLRTKRVLPAATIGTGAATFIWRMRMLQTADSGFQGLAGLGSFAPGVYFNTSSNVMGIYDGSAINTSTAARLNLGKWYTPAITRRTANAAGDGEIGFVDGHIDNATPGIWNQALTNQKFAIGSSDVNSANLPTNGEIGFIALTNTYLSAEAAQEWYTAPWQLVLPDPLRVFFIPAAGGGVTVTAPLASLSYTCQAPTVGTGASVSAPSAALAYTCLTPSVSTGASVSAPAASLAYTCAVPDVTAVDSGVSIVAPLASLAYTMQAATVAAGASVTAPAASIAYALLTPTVTATEATIVTAPLASLSYQMLAPSVASGASVNPPASSLAYQMRVPSVTAGEVLQSPGVRVVWGALSYEVQWAPLRRNVRWQ